MNDNLKIKLLDLLKSTLISVLTINLLSLLVTFTFKDFGLTMANVLFVIILITVFIGMLSFDDGKGLGENITSNDGTTLTYHKLTKDWYYHDMKIKQNIFLTRECFLITSVINILIYVFIK